MGEFDGRCFKQEGRFSLFICLSSVLVNAAEHIVMLPWVFCPGFACCMQTIFKSVQSCDNVSVLSAPVNSFFLDTYSRWDSNWHKTQT